MRGRKEGKGRRNKSETEKREVNVGFRRDRTLRSCEKGLKKLIVRWRVLKREGKEKKRQRNRIVGGFMVNKKLSQTLFQKANLKHCYKDPF